MSAPPSAARFTVTVPPEMLEAMGGGGGIAPRVSREMALQVPAVLRARNLICGSLSTLPLGVWGPDQRKVTNVQYLAPHPDPELAQSVVMAETYEDLLFEGVSWWRVTKFGWHGFPIEAQHVPYGSVFVQPAGGLQPSQQRITPDQSIPVAGKVYIDGIPVPDDQIIRFDSPNPPLLVAAARAIRTCLLLEQTAALYVKDPLPMGYFRPADGADDIGDTEAQDLLDDWADARARSAWGYLPKSVVAETLQWDPEKLQLVDQRAAARLEIALAAGLDPEDLGVSTTSRTYANREQRNQDRINFTLGAYASAVQERLSMRDILPPGSETRVNFAGFLRADALTRMQTYDVGLRVGAYADKDEVREEENKPPLTPAQKAASKPAEPPMPAEPAPPQEPAANGAQQHRREDRVQRETVKFAGGGETVRVQFDAPDTNDFQVDAERRTITGLLLPWGKVANNGYAKWRFTPDSVAWSAVNRIKLNLHHDSTELVGVATRLQSASRGLMGTFKVGRGPEGDRVLAQAEDGIMDGFSVEVDFEDPDSWQRDPTDESVRLVRQATLRGVAITGTPAFDDARLTSVHASRDNGRKALDGRSDEGHQAGERRGLAGRSVRVQFH